MKKIRTPQVQVNFPRSYSAFYSVFFSISIDTVALRNICYAMAAIAIKHMCALSAWNIFYFISQVKY